MERLEIVLAFVNDRNDDRRHLAHLDYETKAIAQALEPLVRDDVIQRPRSIPGATLDNILDALAANERTCIFHFGGHANGSMLALDDGSGGSAAAHGNGLAGYLGRQRGLVLVFLNGCSTVKLVRRLRDAGVKAVVGTTHEIDDRVAAEFATQFYTELRELPLNQAFQRAEDAIRTRWGDDLTGAPRDVNGLDAPTPRAWPWLLKCDPAFETWNLRDEVMRLRRRSEPQLVAGGASHRVVPEASAPLGGSALAEATLELLGNADCPTVGYPTYIDPEFGVSAPGDVLDLLTTQLKIQLLTDDVLLLPDGALFDGYALWRLLASHGHELVELWCRPSATGNTTLAVVQTSPDNPPTLDEAFHAWIGRDDELSPSCLRIGGLSGDVAQARAFFAELRARRQRISLDDYASALRLDLLRKALPHLRQLYQRAHRVPKPQDRLARFRAKLLACFAPRIGDERTTAFFDYLWTHSKVSRSEIQKLFPDIWGAGSHLINQVRQEVVLHPKIASAWLAPQRCSSLNSKARTVLDTLVREQVETGSPDLLVLSDITFAQIGELRDKQLDAILRDLNSTMHMLDRAPPAAVSGFQREYERRIRAWSLVLHNILPRCHAHDAHYQILLEQLATSAASRGCIDPITQDLDVDDAECRQTVGASARRLFSRAVFAPGASGSTAGIFADLVAQFSVRSSPSHATAAR